MTRLWEAVWKGQRGTPAWAKLLVLALPALAFLLVLFYIPLGRVFVEALRKSGEGDAAPALATLRDPYFWQLLRFTTVQALYSAVGSLIIGFPLGYILANRTFPGKQLVQATTLVPFVFPSVAVALGFLVFFGHNGWLNRVLFALFGLRVQILYSLWGIVLAHSFYNAPVVARTVHAAWSRLDPAYEEAARSLGAPLCTRFRTVTLPLIVPGIVTGTLLAFIFSFFSFSIVLALGGSRFATVEVAIYTQVRVLLDYATGSALAMWQTVSSLLAAFLYLGVERRFITGLPLSRPRAVPPLFRWSPLNCALWLYLALLLVFYTGPMLAVVIDSFQGPDGRWSLAAYQQVLFGGYDRRLTDTPGQALRNSVTFAAGSLAFALPLGTLFAYALAHMGRAARGWGARWLVLALETFALAPLMVSSVAFGFAALRAYRTGIMASLEITPQLAIVLAHGVLALPFIVRSLRPAFEQLDRRYVEAARSLGASRSEAFFDVELPLALAAVLVGAALGFSLSVTEMSATIMLARPGLNTLPISLYQHLAARNFSAASAMAVLMVLFTAAALVGMDRLARRWLGPR
ncbi:MAG: iron ABC transporter permease [Firmicutes bacterium]|jgi:thiamine transport system permease protein|nr:iron ABC transporter permease [Bacillota bacterium]